MPHSEPHPSVSVAEGGPPLAVEHLTVVVAPGGQVPSLPRGWREIRVDASQLQGGLSALLVSDRLARALDLRGGSASGAWDRVRHGLRRSLLGDEPATHVGGTLLASFERLAHQSSVPVVWVVQAAHRADADTRGWLARQVRHIVHWPVAVVVGVAPEDAWSLGIAAQARHIWGDAAVWHASGVEMSHSGPGPDDSPSVVLPPETDLPGPEPTRVLEPEEAAARPAVPAGLAAPDTRNSISAEVRATLMAAALGGPVFSLASVAERVGRSEAVVATRLLEAHLSGWTLYDTEDGRLALAPDDREALAAAAPAWLGAAWNPPDSPRAPSAGARPAAAAAPVDPGPPVEPEPSPDPAESPSGPPPSAPTLADLLSAAERARGRGAWAEASRYLQHAAALQHATDPSTVSPLLHLAQARLAWSAAGQGVDLPAALAAARAAEAELRDAADPISWSQAQQLVAAIAHDIGDAEHLEVALATLSAAIRQLQDSGHAREAARLLNDQAAVWVRLGDPVRAVHLLEQSRRIFAAGETPEDAHELAETSLLLARLVLHVPARPGMDGAAVDRAVGHIREAVRVWRQLGDARGVGLALETEARLRLRAEQPEQALERFQEARGMLGSVRDALGLARVADGMAHCLVALGHHEEGVRHLAESVRFNSAVGSMVGLAYNEQSARTMLQRVPAESRAAMMLHSLLRAHEASRTEEGWDPTSSTAP
jgi:tetratricopeptide (TPR) repeat protein